MSGDQSIAFPQGSVHTFSRSGLDTSSLLLDTLTRLGVRQAFGVSGGAIAYFYDSLGQSPIQSLHFRHETGAAFAAIEASFATDQPSLVFTTAGPGLLNALNGMTAARWDGAKVVMISGCTNSRLRGRWATQETSSNTFPMESLYSAGTLFDYAVRLETTEELPTVCRRLAEGLQRPGGFVAHIGLPVSLQAEPAPIVAMGSTEPSAPAASQRCVELCAETLKSGSFVVWTGFGARHAAKPIRRLIDRSGALAMCSPRSKGIVSEHHPRFLGVTGIGGHSNVGEELERRRPDWILVLGSRLGEATSGWDERLRPREGFIHVDLDPRVPGAAYPGARTIGVQAEIRSFVEDLLPHFPPEMKPRPEAEWVPVQIDPGPLKVAGSGPVRPQELMRALQRHVVDGSEAPVLSDCGNSFVWCNHHLRFSDPGRYRVSPLFGSMGHFAAGVVGAALGRGGKAVAVVGDGSMSMNLEISSAVHHGARAVWVVLNDGGYQICREGHEALGLDTHGLDFPQIDFVAVARAMGADGERVDREDALDKAIERAMESELPYLLDVRIDTTTRPPIGTRFSSLSAQANQTAMSDDV